MIYTHTHLQSYILTYLLYILTCIHACIYKYIQFLHVTILQAPIQTPNPCNVFFLPCPSFPKSSGRHLQWWGTKSTSQSPWTWSSQMEHPSNPIRIGMIDTKVLSPQKHLEQKNLRGQHGCKNAKGALRLRIVPLLLPFHVLMLSGLFSGFGCVFFQGHWLVLVSCCFLCSLFVVVENPQFGEDIFF